MSVGVCTRETKKSLIQQITSEVNTTEIVFIHDDCPERETVTPQPVRLDLLRRSFSDFCLLRFRTFPHGNPWCPDQSWVGQGIPVPVTCNRCSRTCVEDVPALFRY
ncbi:hypothetical protein RRG08_036048 [Elysia crispata]|uniref:Uncharacterized protein n=1 Tax=Elysia crispata TaxID=231223 RepID=A0AAE1AKW5_9GAST|nr:hypothetical protein RRG08_036048 [Elysia crispata]